MRPRRWTIWYCLRPSKADGLRLRLLETGCASGVSSLLLLLLGGTLRPSPTASIKTSVTRDVVAHFNRVDGLLLTSLLQVARS